MRIFFVCHTHLLFAYKDNDFSTKGNHKMEKNDNVSIWGLNLAFHKKMRLYNCYEKRLSNSTSLASIFLKFPLHSAMMHHESGSLFMIAKLRHQQTAEFAQHSAH